MVALELFSFLHFLGIAFGLGGVTIAAIVSRKAEKDPELSASVMKILPAISKIIWLGIVLLILSGIGITVFIKKPLNRDILLIKHVLVAWIFIIGIIISTRVRKMQKLAPLKKEKPSLEFLRTRKQLKFFSIINLVLWYVVVLLSVFV